MKKTVPLIAFAASVTALVATAGSSSGDSAATGPAADPLFETIAALDTAVFDAFNHCSAPEQLQKHASYFA